MSNKKAGVYDTGAVDSGVQEAAVAMEWANELRRILQQRGHDVVRTRKNHLDPAPVGRRAGIAKEYGCEIMLSIHCNDSEDGKASGTETFYRGEANKQLAVMVNQVVVAALGTKSRGIKIESQSQHNRLAVLNFPRAVLLELGFLDHLGDRAKMLNPEFRRIACEALAQVLTTHF